MVDAVQAVRAAVVGPDQARVNITWKGENADLPDPVSFDATDGDVKQWVTEAVRAGMPGIAADVTANFGDFVIDRFPANEATPYNRLMLRPKTPFGGGTPTPEPGGMPAAAPAPAPKPKIRIWTGHDGPEMEAFLAELGKEYDVEKLASGSTIVLVDRCDGKGWKEMSSYTELQRELVVKS